MLWKIIVCIRGLLTTGKQNIKASIIHTAFIQYMNCNHFHFVCMVLAFHSYTYTNDPYLFIEGIGIFHEQQIVIYVLFFSFYFSHGTKSQQKWFGDRFIVDKCAEFSSTHLFFFYDRSTTNAVHTSFFRCINSQHTQIV